VQDLRLHAGGRTAQSVAGSAVASRDSNFLQGPGEGAFQAVSAVLGAAADGASVQDCSGAGACTEEARL